MPACVLCVTRACVCFHLQDDDEPPAPSPRTSRPRARARSLSDAEASMVSDDIVMGDADGTAGGGGASKSAGPGKGAGGEGETTEDRRKANEKVRERSVICFGKMHRTYVMYRCRESRHDPYVAQEGRGYSIMSRKVDEWLVQQMPPAKFLVSSSWSATHMLERKFEPAVVTCVPGWLWPISYSR